MLDDRGAVAQSYTLSQELAEYGARVEIPRWERRAPPLAAWISGGLIDTRPGGYLPGVSQRFPTPPPPPGGTPGPSVPPTGTTPPGTVPPGGAPGPVLPPGYTGTPPQYRVLTYHFTADTGGSAANQEVRVSPAIGLNFRICELTLTPLAAVAVGQFLDVVVAASGDTSDAGAFSGQSLFQPSIPDAGTPAQDRPSGIAIPVEAITFQNLGPTFAGGQVIKLISSFVAPAAAVAQFGVTVVVEIGDSVVVLPPGRISPPPPPTVQPPVAPPQTPPPTGGPPVPPYPAPFPGPTARPLAIANAYFPPPAPLRSLQTATTGGGAVYVGVSGIVRTLTAAEIQAGVATQFGQLYSIALTPNGYQTVLI